MAELVAVSDLIEAVKNYATADDISGMIGSGADVNSTDEVIPKKVIVYYELLSIFDDYVV